MAVVKVKKRQGSKKTKKAWRKTDIQDVEDFLEDKRLEERLGAPFKARQDDELFAVDTTPDDGNLIKYQDLIKERRKQILSKPPRCYEILQSDSKVPDPISKRNRLRTAVERKHPILRKKEEARVQKGILKVKEKDQIQNRQIVAQIRRNRPVRGEAAKKDLWDEDNALLGKAPELRSDWVEPHTKQHILVNSEMLKEHNYKAREHNKPHVTPVIEKPHPGMSYNPSFEEHVDLLDKIAEKEKGIVKEDEHIKRVTLSMFRKIPRGEAEAQWMTEMSQGVPNLDPEASVPDEPTSDNEVHSVNPPIDRMKKKDRITRRNMRQEAQKKAEIRLAKIEQKKLSDLDRVKIFQEELSKIEEKQKKSTQKRKANQALRSTQTKRLGRNKFQEREPEFKLPSDLSGSLRALKPEGNLLADRFASFQKRNIMEVTAYQNVRIGKKKRFIKASHKIDWEVHPLNKQARGHIHLKNKKKKTSSSAPLGLK